MISENSLLIQRHKNPIGILLRILIYPAIAYGLWEHHLLIVLLGLVAETLNWTVMPPVERTMPFIQNIIDTELKWLNADNTDLKQLSLGLLGMFPLVLTVGLWMHSGILIVVAFTILIVFNLLMQSIAKGNTSE